MRCRHRPSRGKHKANNPGQSCLKEMREIPREIPQETICTTLIRPRRGAEMSHNGYRKQTIFASRLPSRMQEGSTSPLGAMHVTKCDRPFPLLAKQLCHDAIHPWQTRIPFTCRLPGYRQGRNPLFVQLFGLNLLPIASRRKPRNRPLQPAHQGENQEKETREPDVPTPQQPGPSDGPKRQRAWDETVTSCTKPEQMHTYTKPTVMITSPLRINHVMDSVCSANTFYFILPHNAIEPEQNSA